jgi:hypothetical protein
MFLYALIDPVIINLSGVFYSMVINVRCIKIMEHAILIKRPSHVAK